MISGKQFMRGGFCFQPPLEIRFVEAFMLLKSICKAVLVSNGL
jgi:hypothetical protein